MAWSVGLAAGLCVLGAIAFVTLRGPSLAKRPAAGEFDLPRLTETAILNTSADATFVGIAACAECHAAEHRSYLQSAHSRALVEVDPASEPVDGKFKHAPSGRSYEVYRDGDQMRHRESVEDDAGNTLVAADYPMRYLIGSGRHTRSYLVEDGGFLMESPLTWYASRQKWDMSPGFDRPYHWGFERAADIGCLVCHVGAVEFPTTVYQKVEFREKSIGCERCHGPGSVHVAEEREPLAVATRPRSAGRSTIVHPAKLTRDLAESICAQCHLRGEATVFVRGRRPTDIRPGLPLTDFRIDYHLAVPQSQMKVVGHVEQMRRSRCYIASESLTCTTCHDPHVVRPADEQRAHSMRACRACHTDASCRVDLAERLRGKSGNDCLACHMPQVATDIPHIAFTHHRIGVHLNDSPSGSGARLGNLVPFDDAPQLAEIDRQRNLGLAYLEYAEKQGNPTAFETYRSRAHELLVGVRQRGLPDPEVAAALARISWERNPAAALSLASEALRSEELSARSRVNALFVVGDAALRTNEPEQSAQALEKLVVLRRHSEDWLLLGVCRQRLGDLAAARRDLERAAEIAPFRPEIREALAEIHERLGDSASANAMRQLSDPLRHHAP